MWRPQSHQPLELALEARHLDNEAHVSGSELNNVRDGRITPVIPTTVASMSRSSPNRATIANNSKSKRRRPSNAQRALARPTKQSKRRESTRKRPKRKKKQQGDVFWPIKGILEEETDKQGASRYLVEWEGLDENGDPYTAEWVSDVTDDALAAWQAKQRDKPDSSNGSDGGDNSSRSSQSCGQVLGQFQSQDPLTGAQYKEAVSGEASDSSEIRPSKRRRTVVPDSQDTGGLSSNDHALDNPGTIEYSSNHRLKKIVVELPQNSGLNPLEYLHVQLSESSQPRSVPEIVEDHLFQPPAASSLKEQRDSNRTIPDSQEPSAFSAPETGLRESQPNTDLINSNPSSQASTSQEHSSLSDTSQRLSGTVTGIEIPSHQPELRTCEQVTIPDSGLETWPVEPSLPAKSGVEISSEHHSVSQSLFDPTTFQTQEPFDSQPGAPTSPAGTAQTTSNQNQAGPLVSLHPSQTLSVRSSQFFSIRHPQPAPAAVSDTSSQAAQIVPHSLSHSQDISSQSLFPQGFSVYNSGYSDNDIVPGSSPPRFEHVGSQTSSQVLSQLDGNIRISSSTSIWQGLVSRPKSLHPPSQIQTDKLSTIIKADEAQVEGCHLSSQPLSYSHSPSYGSQLSDRSLRRHSGRPVTPNNKMDDAAPTSEKPVSMKDRLRLIRERRFNSTPSMTPSPVAVERTADGVSSAVQVADVQDTSNAPSAVLDVNSFVSELLPLPVAPEYEEPQTISPALLAPSVGMLHRGVQPIFGIGLDDAAIYERTTITTSYEPAAEEHPTTLDPSALTLSIENDVVEADNEMDDSPLIPTDNGQSGTDGAESIDEPLAANNDAFAAPKPNILPSIDSGPYEFIVTLPLASNIRPQYADIIKETNDDLVAYNAAFTIPPYHAPEAALVAKVDEMFNRLLDICDLPPDLETLQKISPPKVAKFIRTSNSKYAFVGQFLELLARNKTIEKSVLLIARPGPIVDLLNTFLETSGFQPDESVITPISKSWSSDNLFITVYPSANRSYDLRTDYDVIIAFDHTYRRDFLPDALQENPPITLILVTTTSLQHINMRISEQIESLSRKNYLLLALCASINVMLHAKPGHPQAHEAAATFANLVCAPDDDDFYWTHSEPPESIFEHIAASSQLDVAHSTLLPDAGIDRRSSRKRSLDNEGEVEAKRPRMVQPEIVTTNTTNLAVRSHIPDPLRSIIGSDTSATGEDSIVRISVEKAEALAAKMAKLETELETTRSQRDQYRDLADRSKREVDSWTASVNRIQPRYMAALRDRGISQKEREIAVNDQKKMTGTLQSTQATLASVKQENAELKRSLSEARASLLSGDNPELVKMVRLEQEAGQARTKMAELEEKARLAEENRQYAFDAYQSGSQNALDLRRELDDLQQQIVDLTRKANDNIVKINQTQQHNEVRELLRVIEEQRTIVKDRENELNRAKEQLASLKNGRRETRQSSVPRSPRLNVSSPRNPGRRAATEAASGSASRGASPTPFEVGGNLMPGIGSLFAGQQQGNGRYSHLRD